MYFSFNGFWARETRTVVVRQTLCFFCSSDVILSALRNSRAKKRQKDIWCCSFFSLQADCFLPLVQRDLWRICWLGRFKQTNDSYLISICIAAIIWAETFVRDEHTPHTHTYDQAYCRTFSKHTQRICLLVNQKAANYIYIHMIVWRKTTVYISIYQTHTPSIFDWNDLTEINNGHKELFLYLQTNANDYFWLSKLLLSHKQKFEDFPISMEIVQEKTEIMRTE